MKRTLILIGLALAVPALGQQSSSYRHDEHVLNAGGHPANGVHLASASYRITVDALGDKVAGLDLVGPSFRLGGGIVGSYRPPGEVHDLRFEDLQTLRWNPEPSAGHYNLYRDAIGTLASGGYGACLEHSVPATTWSDPGTPAAGSGFFYLVTVENSLSEEGTKGTDASGGVRANPSPCP